MNIVEKTFKDIKPGTIFFYDTSVFLKIEEFSDTIKDADGYDNCIDFNVVGLKDYTLDYIDSSVKVSILGGKD